MNKVNIIGEIGINANGDVNIAKKLIDIAAFAGCDSVKFQKRNPDVCVPEHQKGVMRDTPWGKMTYLDYKKKIEFGKEEFDIIDEYCRERGISWSASPWDIDSVQFLKQYDLPYIKIPSAMLTNHELIKEACWTDSKVILSTGMSTLDEIHDAMAVLREYASSFALLHCNSSYPALTDELNLSCIRTLKNMYQCEVGYSGHEFGLTTTIASIYLGATIIERHITLDRTMWGTDQMCSVEPQGLIKMVRGIRELEGALGDGEPGVTGREMEVRRKLRG